MVPLTGGTFTGPDLGGQLLPGASADWQIVLPDGLGDVPTQIETASSELAWLNKGVFVSVAGRLPGGVIYETYLLA